MDKRTGLFPGRKTLGPLFLLLAPPPFSIILWHIITQLNGSFVSFWYQIQGRDTLSTLWALTPSPWEPRVWKMMLSFMAIQLLMMRLVPGKRFKGPVTPTGHVPEYKANGLQCFALSIILFLAGAYKLEWYNGGIVYDILGPLLSTLNVFSFILCFGLYLKGMYAPSTADCGSSGNMLFDYYWGTELYPRVLGFDIKQFTNCRCGMMFWGISIISYACKQFELYGELSDSMLVSVILQLVYVAKFFWWETVLSALYR